MLGDATNLIENISLLPKYHLALQNFASVINQKKLKKKFKYILPLKNAGLSYKEIKHLGVMIGRRLWHNTFPGSQKRNKGGRPKISPNLIKEIKNFFDKNTTIAANRFLKLQNKNVMYRTSTFVDDFRNFLYKDNLSFCSFKNYVPKYIKKPCRLTDLCMYCQLYKVRILKQLIMWFLYHSLT